MVYIFTVSFDASTADVIDWLVYFHKDYQRHNVDKDGVPDLQPLLEKISAYWYRKGLLPAVKIAQHPGIDHFLSDHNAKIFEYQEYQLKRKRYINTLNSSRLNKLIVLDVARSLGLLVPDSYLLDSSNFKNQGKNLIYKPVNEGGAIQLAPGRLLSVLTQAYEDTNGRPFALTLFQEKIIKKYELRIFYFEGRFWSMAIFSQHDQQTTVDFRNYNQDKPNRTAPFQLPVSIEEKLQALMEKLELNCGSIDMIVSADDQYYFLEVNPVGQYGMVSIPCNYNLDKEIAAFLAYE